MSQTPTPQQNDTQTALDAGRQLATQVETHAIPEIGTFVSVPRDRELRDLTDRLPAPQRLAQQIEVDTPEAFTRYVKLFSSDLVRPVVFCDTSDLADGQSSLSAVIDYPKDQHDPSWNEHRVTMPFAYARAFAEWHEKNEVQMTQIQFARFIENHIGQIAQPDGATLSEMVLQFEANKSIEFKSHSRLRDGSVQLTYVENVTEAPVNGSMKLPSALSLSMPIFPGGRNIYIPARLRFRIDGTKLVLWFELVEIADLIENEMMAISDEVEKALTADIRGLIRGRLE